VTCPFGRSFSQREKLVVTLREEHAAERDAMLADFEKQKKEAEAELATQAARDRGELEKRLNEGYEQQVAGSVEKAVAEWKGKYADLKQKVRVSTTTDRRLAVRLRPQTFRSHPQTFRASRSCGRI